MDKVDKDKLNYNLDFLSYFFLKGTGIEIGALDSPFPLYNVDNCFYVDIDLPSHLKQIYPERKKRFYVDIKGDGATLPFIKDESLDFIIAIQFIEHVSNPIGVIINHLNKLKPDGVLLYSVPDKRYTFDKYRPLTTLEHLILDHEGKQDSRDEHYLEWIKYVEKIQDKDQIKERLTRLKKVGYPIHFHTFTPELFLEMISYLGFEKRLPIHSELLLREQDFFVVILRKRPAEIIGSSYIGSKWHIDYHKMKVLSKEIAKARRHALFLESLVETHKEHIQNLEKENVLSKSHIANLEFKLSLIYK